MAGMALGLVGLWFANWPGRVKVFDADLIPEGEGIWCLCTAVE